MLVKFIFYFFILPLFSLSQSKALENIVGLVAHAVDHCIYLHDFSFLLSSVDMRYRSNRRILFGHSSEVLKLKREGGAIVFDAILVFFFLFLASVFFVLESHFGHHVTLSKHANHVEDQSIFHNLSLPYRVTSHKSS